MRTMLILALLFGLGAAQAEEQSKKSPSDPKVAEVASQAMGTTSLHVTHLREMSCGGASDNMSARNAAFAACVMYLVGAVDMMRELQKMDPVHALPVCVPRNISGGALLVEIQEHVEASAPWRQQQVDAATAVIAALRAKWPCQRR
jgi:hypothetical protein